jgi:4-amino-4-deoxy-L-arabinose transferase-like glycosyltransferase
VSAAAAPGVVLGQRGWRAWLPYLALAVFAIAVLMVHLELTVRRPDRAIFTFDSAEYAVAGRELVRTGRLATPFAYAAHLRPGDRPPFPMVVGHPLVPLLDAAAFLLGAARPALTLVPPAVAFLVTVFLTAVLARRSSSSVAAGVCAGGAFAMAPTALRYAGEGLSEMPFAALWAGAFLLLRDPGGRRRSFLLGVLLGLAHLTRPVACPTLPVWLVAAAALAPRGKRIGAVVAVLAGFLPFAAGLCLYKWAAAGDAFLDPAGTMLLLQLSPEFTMARLNTGLGNPVPLAHLLAHPAALAHKLVRFAPAMAVAAASSGGRLLGVLFVIRLLALVWDRRERRFLLAVLGIMACLVVLASLTVPYPRVFFPMMPAVVALGIAEVHRLTRALRLGTRAAAITCVIVGVWAVGRPLAGIWGAAVARPEFGPGAFTEAEWRGLGERLAQRIPRGTTVLSDAAPWIAWYADRAAVTTPFRPEEVAEVGRRTPVGALAVTNEWVIRQPGNETWRALHVGRARLVGWSRAETVASGRLRAVLLLPSSVSPTTAR